MLSNWVILWLTSGPVRHRKAMTTYFTAIRLNKKYPSLKGYKNGIRKC